MQAGRTLERLVEATWNSGIYAPGIYFYTLYADGRLLTKKMIKQ